MHKHYFVYHSFSADILQLYLAIVAALEVGRIQIRSSFQYKRFFIGCMILCVFAVSSYVFSDYILDRHWMPAEDKAPVMSQHLAWKLELSEDADLKINDFAHLESKGDYTREACLFSYEKEAREYFSMHVIQNWGNDLISEQGESVIYDDAASINSDFFLFYKGDMLNCIAYGVVSGDQITGVEIQFEDGKTVEAKIENEGFIYVRENYDGAVKQVVAI